MAESSMYQEWESPSFSLEQLLEFCKEFFRSQDFETTVEARGKEKSVITARISSISETLVLELELKGTAIRLSIMPSRHAYDGLRRMAGSLVYGQIFKHEAQKQLILDRVEREFWESIDSKLAEIQSSRQSNRIA